MENRKRKERDRREKGIREERNGTERKYNTKEMKGEKRIGIEWRI